MQGTRGQILKSKSQGSSKVSVVKDPFVIVLYIGIEDRIEGAFTSTSMLSYLYEELLFL